MGKEGRQRVLKHDVVKNFKGTRLSGLWYLKKIRKSSLKCKNEKCRLGKLK